MADDDPGDRDFMELSFISFVWGVLSALSLIIGALIGIYCAPSRTVRAALMAFGSGALIEALSIELFAKMLVEATEGEGDHPPVGKSLIFVGIGGAILGGLLFAGLNEALNSQGAWARKVSTIREHVSKLRYAFTRNLVARLKTVPLLAQLEDAELHSLVKRLPRDSFSAGDLIFSSMDRYSSLYFLLEGEVELVTRRYLVASQEDNAPVSEEEGLSPTLSHPLQGVAEETDSFRISSDQVFGELSLLTGVPVLADAVALTDIRVLRIPNSELNRLLEKYENLKHWVNMTAVEQLRRSPPFKLCSPSVVARLVAHMESRQVPAGEVLFEKVDQACPIYYVVLGRVRVVYPLNPSSSPFPLRKMIGAGELLGTEHVEWGKEVEAKAVATELTTILKISRKDFDNLSREDPKLRAAIRSLDPSLCLSSGFPCSEGTGVSSKGGGGGVLSASSAISSLPYTGHKSPTELGWRREEEEEEGGGVSKRPSFSRASSQPRGGRGRSITAEPLSLKEVGGEPEAFFSMKERRKRHSVDQGGGYPFSRSLESLDLPEVELVLQEGSGGTSEKEEEVKKGEEEEHGKHKHAAVMIWLGILIDSIPESLVIGILVAGNETSSLYSFFLGVFLSNLPEAMSSSSTLFEHRMRKRVILTMWTSVVLITGIGAATGAVIFDVENPSSAEQHWKAGIEGLAGGAMLCMIANTALPEAFHDGGDVVGLSTLAGFLVALLVAVLSK